MKTLGVSLDIWKTLYSANPKFLTEQAKVAQKMFNIPAERYLSRRSTKKAIINQAVQTYGLHYDRTKIYADIMQTTRWSGIDTFILESDELFLKHPPLVMLELPLGNFEFTVSSNTCFIYSDILKKCIKKDFGINTGNYSDMIGLSKPNERMFQYSGQRVQPKFHVGDDIFTDSACKKVGVQFIHISEWDNFKDTLKYY